MSIRLTTQPTDIEGTYRHALSIADADWAAQVKDGLLTRCGQDGGDADAKEKKLRAIARKHGLESEVFTDG